MGKKIKPLLVSLFAGLELTDDWRINLIRLFFYFMFIVAYFIPASTDLSIDGCISFSFVLSFLIFAVKFILAVLNVIVNHTKSIPQNAKPTNHESKISEFECDTAPEGVPQELWDLRRTIPKDAPITETIFSGLIEKGFDPTTVVQFVQRIVEIGADQNPETIEEQETTKEVLEICGKERTVPFNRTMIDSLFGTNYSFVYVVVIFVFTFFMNLVASSIMKYFPIYFRYWLCFIYGPALYSTIHPPDVDCYSTTRGDNYTGIARPFSIIILGGGYLLIKTNIDLQSILDELKIPIPKTYIVQVLEEFFHTGLLAFPIWSILFLGHPVTILNWLLEWGTRYLYGHSGAAGVGNSIVLTLRSLVLSFILYGILNSQYSKSIFSLCCTLCVTLIQIPMNCSFSCHLKSVQTIIMVLVMGFLAFLGCYIGSDNTFQSGALLYDLSTLFALFFDIIWPYASAVNSYMIFSMRIIRIQSKTINTLRMLTPCFIAPMVIGIVLTIDPVAPFITSCIIIMSIHKAMTEPHVFAAALLFNRVTLLWEFGIRSQSLGLFYSIMICRKILSVISILDYWVRARVLYIVLKLDLFDDNSFLILARDFCISRLAMMLPGVDRIFPFITLLWSFITGSPFNVPQNMPYLLIPFPPRPNSFWTQILSGSIDITRAYLQHRTEHPIETPVYTSMVHSLSVSLQSLIKSGRLGIVSSNDFFLFVNDSLAAFVHIISLEPNTVHFQVRGLEYNDKTICHLGEIAKLKDDISSYEGFVPNFISPVKYYGTNWRTRATGVKMWQYNVAKIKEENAFIGVERDELDLWTCISFAKHITPRYLKQINGNFENDGEVGDMMALAMRLFKIEQNLVNNKKIIFKFNQFISYIITDDSLDLEKLFTFFHGSVDPIFQATAQSMVLYLSLLSMDLGPEDETFESISAFISDVDMKYFVAPIQSTEFNSQFEMENKDLVAYEDTSDGRNLLYFTQTEVVWDVISVQKEVIRSYWASEAFLQMFFGEDNSERRSIQEDDHTMRNLIVQACNIPIGYPALVSPIGISYSPPHNSDFF